MDDSTKPVTDGDIETSILYDVSWEWVRRFLSSGHPGAYMDFDDVKTARTFATGTRKALQALNLWDEHVLHRREARVLLFRWPVLVSIAQEFSPQE